jgi:hypothetical protein
MATTVSKTGSKTVIINGLKYKKSNGILEFVGKVNAIDSFHRCSGRQAESTLYRTYRIGR